MKSDPRSDAWRVFAPRKKFDERTFFPTKWEPRRNGAGGHLIGPGETYNQTIFDQPAFGKARRLPRENTTEKIKMNPKIFLQFLMTVVAIHVGLSAPLPPQTPPNPPTGIIPPWGGVLFQPRTPPRENPSGTVPPFGRLDYTPAGPPPPGLRPLRPPPPPSSGTFEFVAAPPPPDDDDDDTPRYIIRTKTFCELVTANAMSAQLQPVPFLGQHLISEHSL